MSGISYQERQVGQPIRCRLWVRPADGIPGTRRAIRELVGPLWRDFGRALRCLRRLVAVWLAGVDNDIYFQIGLVTLIGLAAKNAILIVEFANNRYQSGKSGVDAAIEAAKIRFRPIVMTSMAFILGVVPLVLATGAGAASRNSIGTGVFGGMLAATFLAIFFVPLFFVLVRKLRRRGSGQGTPPGRARFRQS